MRNVLRDNQATLGRAQLLASEFGGDVTAAFRAARAREDGQVAPRPAARAPLAADALVRAAVALRAAEAANGRKVTLSEAISRVPGSGSVVLTPPAPARRSASSASATPSEAAQRLFSEWQRTGQAGTFKDALLAVSSASGTAAQLGTRFSEKDMPAVLAVGASNSDRYRRIRADLRERLAR